MLRLLRGEDLEMASRSLGVTAAAAGTWPAGGMVAPQMPEMPEALRGFLEQLNQGGLEQPGLGGLPGLSPAHAPDPVPEGARFTTHSFSDEAGSRDYKLYVPSTYRGQPSAPLVVMLHGCTQSPDDFAAGTRMKGSPHGLLKIARYAPFQSRMPFKPRSKERFEREAPRICRRRWLDAQTEVCACI